MKPTDFSKYLTDYLTQYLPVECGVSRNTIQTYSHTFIIFLRYMHQQESINPEKLYLKDITKQKVIDFLEWLEKDRKCSVATRNARLSTLHSFFRFIQYRDVAGLKQWQDILSIRSKKSASPEMAYFTVEGLKHLLKQPDIQTKHGRRDLALLGLLYDSGARVQELINLTPADLRFEETTTVKFIGKGNKVRIVPLSSPQVQNLKRYMMEHNLFDAQNKVHPLFSNPQNSHLSRVAILNMVKKYADMARQSAPDLIPDKIGCHTFRHSKAMHLLEAEINLVWIRDFLGHVSTTTTEVYVRASSKMKTQALKKLNPSIVVNEKTSWQKNGQLLLWLKSLQ